MTPSVQAMNAPKAGYASKNAVEDILTPSVQTMNAPKAGYTSKNAEHDRVQQTLRDKQSQEHVRFTFILSLQCIILSMPSD